MKNLTLPTAHTQEEIDIETIINPEGEEQRELSNREWQFLRLRNATRRARELKSRAIEGAPTQNEKLYWEAKPINFFLINFVYKQTQEGITEFKKFNEWKQAGATILKGEKAFPIWGQPIGKIRADEAAQKGIEYIGTDEEMRKYPICYVFSNLQVRTIERKEAVC
jgi:hypothetical protein